VSARDMVARLRESASGRFISASYPGVFRLEAMGVAGGAGVAGVVGRKIELGE